MFRIVAHRGVTAAAPENTMTAFRRALELDGFTTGSGPIFERTAADLDTVRVLDRDRVAGHRIPMLEEDWMRQDVVAHAALQRARLANAQRCAPRPEPAQ